MKQYILNRETSRIELHFTKEDYNGLDNSQKQKLKRFYTWSRYTGAWVSKGTKDHYWAIKIAKELGFVEGETIGERLSYAEELERKAEKAEARAERYEQYSENAVGRAKGLQAELNGFRGDISFMTQPIIAGHAGSQAFGRQRERIFERYAKGFDEYRKSAYFAERAELARETADMTKLKDKVYLNNRIEESEALIRKYQRRLQEAEEQQNEEWAGRLLESLEYEIDKLAFHRNCMEELGGVEYSKDNIKAGYYIRGRWDFQKVVKANAKTVEIETGYGYNMRIPYAEIRDVKIPEDWEDPKEEQAENPFKVGDVLVQHNAGGTRIIYAYQVTKTTAKQIVLQELVLTDGKPIAGAFKSDKTYRRAIAKDSKGADVVAVNSWFSYKYNAC